MTSFAEVVAWSRDEARFAGSIDADWMQGRTAFGGVLAAIGMRAMRATAPDAGPPRSMMASFFGPVGPEPGHVTAEVVRRGRFMTHARAEIRQDGKLRTQITAVFAEDRQSTLEVAAEPAPARPDPDTLVDIPFIEGVTPQFVRNFAFRWTDGGFPFSGAPQARLGGWCRHRTDPGPDPHVALLGLVDAWPSPLLPKLTRPAPASSVTWSTLFVDVPTTFDPHAWWWYGSEAIAARHGHAGMRGALYHRDGRLAATVEQLVALFDRPAAAATGR